MVHFADEIMPVAINNARMLPGRLYGLSDPGLRFELVPHLGIWPFDASRFADCLLREIEDIAGTAIPVEDIAIFADDAGRQAIEQLLRTLLALQQLAGFPVTEPGKFLSGPDLGGVVQLVLPIPPGGLAVMRSVIETVARMFGQFIAGGAISGLLREAYEQLQSYELQPGNMVHFLATARSLDIPYGWRPGNIFEFGQGARCRRLQFSFTDATPLIATKLARNKIACARILRQAGIPVPQHASVTDENAAIRVANELGYPVVVKPADLDGGKGVAPGLVNDEGVANAFHAAAALSSSLLVEKHFEGRDYRLVIMHDELVLAFERKPAGVVGSGQHTVRQLLDQMNAERAISTGEQRSRRPVIFDEEAAALLAGAGMHEHTVPAKGVYVKLRRAANFELGGTVQVVTDSVHPDNVRLARRAVATIGLDLAGVDLLTTDITQSWMQVGAVICEVNGQPQFGAIRSPNIYEIVLRAQVQGNGRIPVAVIAGSGDEALALQQEVTDGLRKRGLRVGQASRAQVRIDDEIIAPGPLGIFAACQALIWDRGIDVLVAVVSDATVLDTGLPFDRIDLLIAESAPDSDGGAWENAMGALHSMCSGTALTIAEPGPAIVDGGSGAYSNRLIGQIAARKQIVEIGLDLLAGTDGLWSGTAPKTTSQGAK